ncbi:MAG: hypothetical protein ACRCYU_01200 [Nocardioides sp.]
MWTPAARYSSCVIKAALCPRRGIRAGGPEAASQNPLDLGTRYSIPEFEHDHEEQPAAVIKQLDRGLACLPDRQQHDEDQHIPDPTRASAPWRSHRRVDRVVAPW